MIGTKHTTAPVRFYNSPLIKLLIIFQQQHFLPIVTFIIFQLDFLTSWKRDRILTRHRFLFVLVSLTRVTQGTELRDDTPRCRK